MLLGVMTPEELERTSDRKSAEQFLSVLVAENRATQLILPAQYPNDYKVLKCGVAGPLSNGEEIPEKRHSDGTLPNADATKMFWIAAERLPMIQAIYPNARVEPVLSVPHACAWKNLGTRRKRFANRFAAEWKFAGRSGLMSCQRF